MSNINDGKQVRVKVNHELNSLDERFYERFNHGFDADKVSQVATQCLDEMKHDEIYQRLRDMSPEVLEGIISAISKVMDTPSDDAPKGKKRKGKKGSKVRLF